VIDVVDVLCCTTGTDVVEIVVVAPTPASVPWGWKKKRVGAVPVTLLDGVGAQFHIGTPVGSVSDS